MRRALGESGGGRGGGAIRREKKSRVPGARPALWERIEEQGAPPCGR